MINIKEFQTIRQKQHLIVLDTNILLELYRQPANISIDIISALEMIKDKIYIPRQVYDEYIKNYRILCGSEKKKYQKVRKELSDSIRKFQNDVEGRTIEYRKHNYTDISKLQSELNLKIADIQDILKDFEEKHKLEIQLNVDFLNNDKVKCFVDLLKSEGKIGKEIPFSQMVSILQEGQVRFDNLIPPGFMDKDKEGMDKYGDLLVWKSIITIAKEENANIIFVCNDIKEDWWEKDKENPIDLRNELLLEFREVNPDLKIHFLTLDKFFRYIAEELKIGQSKSALQLSAKEDVKRFLDVHEETIFQRITQVLCSIDIESELEEEFLEAEEERIYWNIEDVSVDKEEKNIIYYINFDISVIAGLTYHEPGNYPCYAGEVALALEGKGEFVIEEYATEGILQELEIELDDIVHIEPEDWKLLKGIFKDKSCKELIKAKYSLEIYKNNIQQMSQEMDRLRNISGAVVGVQEIVKPLKEFSDKMELIGGAEMICKVAKGAVPLQEMAKAAVPLQEMAKAVAPLQEMAKTAAPLQEISKNLAPINEKLNS